MITVLNPGICARLQSGYVVALTRKSRGRMWNTIVVGSYVGASLSIGRELLVHADDLHVAKQVVGFACDSDPRSF